MARMDDGFATLIEFSEDSDVQMWEKEVTPPGVFDMGRRFHYPGKGLIAVEVQIDMP